MTQLYYISTYENETVSYYLRKLVVSVRALSDAKANTATYFCCCVSDLPNKLTGGFERRLCKNSKDQINHAMLRKMCI